MPKNLFFLIKTLIIVLLISPNVLAIELPIIPLKKPILNKAQTNEKLTKGILKPKSKPKDDKFEEKQEKKEIVKKEKTKINFLMNYI